jgi:hypothetical protein
MKNKYMINNSLLQHKSACLFVHLFLFKFIDYCLKWGEWSLKKYLQGTRKKNKTEKFVPLNNLHNHTVQTM